MRVIRNNYFLKFCIINHISIFIFHLNKLQTRKLLLKMKIMLLFFSFGHEQKNLCRIFILNKSQNFYLIAIKNILNLEIKIVILSTFFYCVIECF